MLGEGCGRVTLAYGASLLGQDVNGPYDEAGLLKLTADGPVTLSALLNFLTVNFRDGRLTVESGRWGAYCDL